MRLLSVAVLAVAGMVRAETLTVSSDTTINADASYDGIVFTAGATLSGSGKITLGSAGIQVSAGTATIASAVAFDGSAEQDITVASGATLNLNGVLSGAAPLTINGAGTTVLAGANTFTGTLRLMGGGKVYVRNDLALGSTDAQTIVESTDTHGNTKVYFGSADIAEPFDLYLKDNVYALYFEKDARTVFRGSIKRCADSSIGAKDTARINLKFAENDYLVLSNSWDFGYATLSGESDTTVEFWEPITCSRVLFNNGTYLFHSSVNVNTWKVEYGIYPGDGSLFKMFTNDVFCTENSPSTVSIGALLRMTNENGVFDLNGFDQTILAIYGDCKGTIKSDEPAMLSLVGTTKTNLDTTVSVPFTGKVGLTLARQSTNKKTLAMTLTGVSTSTGDLVVSNGCALALGSTATWAGTNIVVRGTDSTLTLADKDNLTAGENLVVSIHDSGTLALNYTGSKTISKLVVGETVYTDTGVYGATGVSGVTHAIDSITGTGTLTILPSTEGQTCTWVATPEATDLSVATAANWQDATKPDFTKGTDKAIFTASGAGDAATIDTAAAFAGITLTRPAAGSFGFSGSGSLALGVDGLAVTAAADTTEARTFTNAVATTLAYSQTWSLPGSNTVFRQLAPLSASEHITMDVEGAGELHLATANSDFYGTLQLNVSEAGLGTDVYVEHSDALRNANLVVESKQTSAESYPFSFTFAAGVTNVLDGTVNFDVNGIDNYNAFVFKKNSCTTFNGSVRMTKFDRCTIAENARVVYAGGYESGNGLRAGDVGKGAVLVFTNTPSSIGSLSLTGKTNVPVRIELWTERNAFTGTSYGLDMTGNVILDCRASFAVITNLVSSSKYAPRFYYGMSKNYRPEMKLNGFDQSVAYLAQNGTSVAGDPACVSSDTAAQLHVYQSTDGASRMLAFTGGAGLTLSGQKELQLLNTPNTTTGRLEVVGGNLTLGASWSNATAVVVREKGTLTLQASELFGKKVTAMSLESGSTLALGGTTQNVLSLTVDGVELPSGTYQAGNAALKGIVTGEGSLIVRGNRGMMLFFR